MPATPRWNITCDFDGTIVSTDVTDRLLERFADPAWQELERAWAANAISSRECMIRQAELLTMTTEEMKSSLEHLAIDPAFADFVAFAQQADCHVQVASEGYTQVIRLLLSRGKVPVLPIAATHLIANGPDKWVLGTPFVAPGCESGAATCKCSVAKEGRLAQVPTLLIGDGRSDFCLARRADFVFARGSLLEHCRRHGLPHAAVSDFLQARHHLSTLLLAEQRPHPSFSGLAAAHSHE